MTIKQLEAEVNEQLAEIRHKLKQKSKYWLIAAGVAMVLIIILLITVFKKGTTNENYESQIRTLDSVVKYQEEKIETLERYNELIDSNIQTLNEKYKANRPTETRIITKYEKVPVDVRGLDKSGLRNEVTNFK